MTFTARLRSLRVLLPLCIVGLSQSSAGAQQPSVKLRVFDQKGGPVQAFALTLRSRASKKLTFSTVAEFSERQYAPRDFADEFLAVRDLPEAEYYAVVNADLHAPTKSEPFEVKAGAAPPEVIVRLTTGGSITGRVVDEAGKAVAGVAVTSGPDHPFGVAEELLGPMRAKLPDATVRTATTDAEGRFGLPLLVYGSYRLTTAHPRFCEAVANGFAVQGSSPVEAPAIPLTRGAIVEGKVTRGDAPLGKVNVWVSLPNGQLPSGGELARKRGFRPCAVSGEDGRFRFAYPIPPGTYVLCASLDAKADPFIVEFQNGRRIVIEPGQENVEETFDLSANKK